MRVTRRTSMLLLNQVSRDLPPQKQSVAAKKEWNGEGGSESNKNDNMSKPPRKPRSNKGEVPLQEIGNLAKVEIRSSRRKSHRVIRKSLSAPLLKLEDEEDETRTSALEANIDLRPPKTENIKAGNRRKSLSRNYKSSPELSLDKLEALRLAIVEATENVKSIQVDTSKNGRPRRRSIGPGIGSRRSECTDDGLRSVAMPKANDKKKPRTSLIRENPRNTIDSKDGKSKQLRRRRSTSLPPFPALFVSLEEADSVPRERLQMVAKSFRYDGEVDDKRQLIGASPNNSLSKDILQFPSDTLDLDGIMDEAESRKSSKKSTRSCSRNSLHPRALVLQESEELSSDAFPGIADEDGLADGSVPRLSHTWSLRRSAAKARFERERKGIDKIPKSGESRRRKSSRGKTGRSKCERSKEPESKAWAGNDESDSTSTKTSSTNVQFIPSSESKLRNTFSCLLPSDRARKCVDMQGIPSTGRDSVVNFADEVSIKIMTPPPKLGCDYKAESSGLPIARRPHLRQYCPVFVFNHGLADPLRDERAKALNENSKCCDSCYCFICDLWAHSCCQWITPTLNILRADANHCCAAENSTYSKIARQIFRQSLMNLKPFASTYIPSFVSGPGPFPPKPDGYTDPTITECRKCGWFNRFAHRHYRLTPNPVGPLDFCHNCGRVASTLDFCKEQSLPLEPRSDDFILGEKVIPFHILAHDPRDMISCQRYWADHAHQYDPSELEEDAFNHQFGERPTLRMILESLYYTGENITCDQGSEISIPFDQVTFKQETDSLLLQFLGCISRQTHGDIPMVKMDIKAMWSKRSRSGVRHGHFQYEKSRPKLIPFAFTASRRNSSFVYTLILRYLRGAPMTISLGFLVVGSEYYHLRELNFAATSGEKTVMLAQRLFVNWKELNR